MKLLKSEMTEKQDGGPRAAAGCRGNARVGRGGAKPGFHRGDSPSFMKGMTFSGVFFFRKLVWSLEFLSTRASFLITDAEEYFLCRRKTRIGTEPTTKWSYSIDFDRMFFVLVLLNF